jgi:hypothetical protein
MGFGGKIKRLTADKHMSDALRRKANWTCQRCDKDYSEKPQGLQLSHFISRANWSVRFDPKVALVLCAACHQYVEGHPVDHINLWRELHGGIYGRFEGDAELNALLGRSECKSRAQYARANHSKIGKHYLAIVKELDELTEEEIAEYEIHPPIYRDHAPFLT